MRVNADRDAGLQGHYAGIITRAGAFVFDIFIILLVFAAAGQALDYLVAAVFGADFSLKTTSVLPDLLLIAWGVVYFAYPIALGGRTLGMAILGLKVVRADGSDVDGWHALVRVLVLPLSFLLFWFGIVLIVLRRDRRALHDLIARTAVVYSWDARSARLRVLAKQGPVVPDPGGQPELESGSAG
jgi:uncharacterized RDD family membrane protein YckC